MAELKEVVALVEEVLTELDLDPNEARDDEFEDIDVWGLQSGSANVIVKLEQDEVQDDVIIQVFSPMLHLADPYDAKLLLRLLELNAALVTASFCVVDDEVTLLVGRSCQGIDKVEIQAMITDVAALADHFDDLLAEEFGLKLFGDDGGDDGAAADDDDYGDQSVEEFVWDD